MLPGFCVAFSSVFSEFAAVVAVLVTPSEVVAAARSTHSTYISKHIIGGMLWQRNTINQLRVVQRHFF